MNAGVDDDDERPEGALRERDRRFGLIVDGLPALVTIMTPEGELEHANRRVLEYFGATFEELKGLALGETLYPDDRPAVLTAWRESLDTGRPYEFEGRQRRADGTYRWFHMHGSPLRDDEGRAQNEGGVRGRLGQDG